jgi:hypothetical protein
MRMDVFSTGIAPFSTIANVFLLDSQDELEYNGVIFIFQRGELR